MNLAFINMFSLLQNKVQNDPGAIIGPISKFLGMILNGIFSVISLISENHSLGFSIIIFTFIVRALMIPFSVKSQKSMSKMQQIQPEMDKIKKKYGDSKDPELQKKMNAEIQALYSKSGVNPLGGCLPMFIQFPIFIALNYCMQQSFMFIDRLNEIYRGMVDWIFVTTDYLKSATHADLVDGFLELASYKIVQGREFVVTVPENMMKILNKFRTSDWDSFFAIFSDIGDISSFNELFIQKNNIENFFGINMLENPGLAFPAILIPILSGAFSFLSSWQMQKTNPSADKNSKMSQQIMMFAMPAMMLYFTFTMPAGVGLYWTVSSAFQILQQMILNKRYRQPAAVKGENEASNIVKTIKAPPKQKKR